MSSSKGLSLRIISRSKLSYIIYLSSQWSQMLNYLFISCSEPVLMVWPHSITFLARAKVKGSALYATAASMCSLKK